MFNFIKNISSTEFIIIVAILLILFGSTIMIRLGRMGGKTFKEIKKVKKEFTESLEEDGDHKSNKN